EAGAPLPQTLTPVYPSTQGLSQASLRKAINEAMGRAELGDTLPQAVLEAYGLAPFEASLRTLHHPPPDVSPDELAHHRHPARRRTKLDELLAQQLALAAARAARMAQQAPSLKPRDDLLERLRGGLPFQLTGAQQRAIDEIAADLSRGHPMHRLLQ